MKNVVLKLLLMGLSYTAVGVFTQLLLFNMLIAADLEAQQIKSVKEVSVDIEIKNQRLVDVFDQLEKTTDFILFMIRLTGF
ncbi:MAG: hypothetical protein HC819_11745 [Cyclobacteriaceae bacterium]|nr:hypothetical protein [Cyclobacteriaceae bacterium]